jgi:poly(3-hydroxybutyrate) depolymerase
MQSLATERAPATGQQITLTVTYEGVQRDVAVFVPSTYVSGTAMPLVVALHGGSGDASVMYDPDKRIVTHAESDGFVAVFPNGLPKPDTPNSQNYYWGDPVNRGYMAFLMDQISARYTIDTQRIYFIGFSGGAKLIYNLAADPLISARIAGIGTVAGEIGGKPVEPCASPWEIIDPSVTGGVAMPAYLVQGERDKRMPLTGGFDDDSEQILVGFETKMAIWQHFTGAHTEAEYPSALPSNVTARVWTNAHNGYAVVSVVDHTLAHRWPDDWDVMSEFWRFFQSMPAR